MTGCWTSRSGSGQGPHQGADGRMGPQPVHVCCVDLEKGELLQKSGLSVQYSPCEDVDFCSTRPAESQTGSGGGWPLPGLTSANQTL